MVEWHSEVAHDCPALIDTLLESFAAYTSIVRKVAIQMKGHIVSHVDHGCFFIFFWVSKLVSILSSFLSVVDVYVVMPLLEACFIVYGAYMLLPSSCAAVLTVYWLLLHQYGRL